MTIRGLELTSLVDFPGEVCTTVFFGGCNLRCPWCQNSVLVHGRHTPPAVEPEETLKLLLSRRAWIRAVCLTGGEPTLVPDLEEFLVRLKAHGFAVKLDTNGTFPDVLFRLLRRDLLDYVAMDVKAPLERYRLLAGVEVDGKAISSSVDLLKSGGTPYEFRTTVVPGLLRKDDLLAICRWLAGARRYVLQQFRPSGTLLDPRLAGVQPYPASFLYETAAELDDFFLEVEVRD